MGHYDVIVVGAGGTMGSSAMYHLAKSGSKASRLGSQGWVWRMHETVALISERHSRG